MKKKYLLLLLFCPGLIFAQLEFCKGSKGDPIFHEDFGRGQSTGPPLAATTTNYNYVTVDPNDGEYTISGRIGQENGTWHSFFPGTTVSNGRALIVNAGFTSGLFYTTPITGLCENSSYEFSAYLMNIYNLSSRACINGGIPINVRFEIWDHSNTVLLKEGSTGNINSTATPIWQQYALTFQSGPGQGTVILKMFNNGVGGCGNDLAIDDIIFRSCGDLTVITGGEDAQNPYEVCESSTPEGLRLTANPDHSIYKDHFFQWQESNDGINWTNISGENSEDYFIPEVSSSKFFRVKVAEDAANLDNNLCSTASEIFEFRYIPTPAAPISGGNLSACNNVEIPPLVVTAAQGEIVSWYDAPEGGNLLLQGSLSYKPLITGTYYAEAARAGCPPGPRTAITYTSYEVPDVKDESSEICEDGTVLLDAGVPDVIYEWSTGEIGKEIIVNRPGNFFVRMTTSAGCILEKNFEIKPVVTPQITGMLSEENGVTILSNPGNFEYSLDGLNFQQSAYFNQVPGGVYTAYIRDLSLCNTVTLTFPHIVIQKYFSPNNDGYNDIFLIRGVEYFQSSFIRVYNRYGTLIITGDGENFSWDGTFNGKPLPADDYWYELFIEDFKEIKGHISLLR